MRKTAVGVLIILVFILGALIGFSAGRQGSTVTETIVVYTPGRGYTLTAKTYALGQNINLDYFKLALVVKGVKTVDKYAWQVGPSPDVWLVDYVREGYTAVIVSVSVSNLDVHSKHNPIISPRLITLNGHEFSGSSCIGLSSDYLAKSTWVNSKEPPEGYYVIGFTEECDEKEYLPPETTRNYVYVFPMKANDKPLFFKFNVYSGEEVLVKIS